MSLVKVCRILLFILLAGWGVPKADAALTDNGNKTVTDSRTGLVWQQEGPDYTGYTGYKNWGDALTYCEGLSLGGADDWRLPNVKELNSLAAYVRDSETIYTTYFPNTSRAYWSSTTIAFDPGTAWIVFFPEGIVDWSYPKGDFGDVRCVRGGYSGGSGGGGAPQIPSTPVGPFEMLVFTVACIAGYGFWKMRRANKTLLT